MVGCGDVEERLENLSLDVRGGIVRQRYSDEQALIATTVN